MRRVTAMAIWLAAVLIGPGGLPAQDPTRPYAGEETREIKALSAEEVDDYLDGAGMGLAKAAELNGFPGPLHVLELADELELTHEQMRRTHEIFEEMREQAKLLGARVVEKERELDRLFASETVTEPELRALTGEIGRLQGELRATHLHAHLAQKALLSEHQVRRYIALRGYGSGTTEPHDPSKHHHPTRHPE